MQEKLRSLLALMVFFAGGGIVHSVDADWAQNAGGLSGADPQDIVISLKSNPMTHIEQACLAVTFARSLSMNPRANITLFVTLGGVSLADKHSAAFNEHFMCTTPWGVITLKENLEEFLDEKHDDSLVVCPICWTERYGSAKPGYGVLPGSSPGVPDNAIGVMMFNADKILDF